MHRYLLIISIFCLSNFAIGQKEPTAQLQSPYHSLKTHLEYLQDESYNEKLASAPFRIKGLTEEEEIEKAVKLKQIWDGEGYYINLDEVPKAPDYTDSGSHQPIYVISKTHPEIYLIKKGEKWLYSEASIKAIDGIHDKVFPFGTDRLLELLPKMGTKKIMGLYIYQYLGILILAMLSVIIHKIFTFLFERLLLNVLLQAGYERLADRFLLPVARPTSIFAVIILLRLFIPVLQLHADLSFWIMLVIRALLPLFATIVFYRFVDVLAMYLEKLAKRTESTLDDQLVPLMRKTLKTFVVGVGTLFILQNLDIPIVPLLTGLSIGGLAFALAAQDTIKNFFGSLMIFIDKPFQIGNWITSGDIDGSVEEVGFRSSRIRTFRNSVMYVPNGKLADSTIDNHGMRQYRRYYTTIAIAYDTPAHLIELYVEGLRKVVENHPDTRKDYFNIYLNDLGQFSLNVMFYIFFEVPDWPAELKARHEIILEIIKLGRQLGIQFAFPTQTLQIQTFPGQSSLTPVYMKPEQTADKMSQYFQSQNPVA